VSRPPNVNQPGQYSPDGRWYWDGRQWVPVQQGPPAPPSYGPAQQPYQPPRPAQAARRGRGPLKFILIACALIVVLVGCGIGGTVLYFLHTQDVITLPFLPPTATTIFNKPLQGTLRDAGVHETIKDKQNGDTTTAQGTITFSPRIAMQQHYNYPAGRQTDELWADGLHYGRVQGLPWELETGSSPSDLYFLKWADTTLGRMSGTVVGEETLPQGKCWHIKDFTGYQEFWIRESDGFPIKVESERAYVHASYTFDNYNQGRTIQVPSESQITTTIAKGSVGQGVDSPGGRVQVSEVRNPYSPPNNKRADHGYRLISVNVSYTNTGSGPATLKTLAVSDSRGFVAGNDLAPSATPSPAFPTSTFTVTPGQTLSGWVTFEVKDDARALTLQLGGTLQSTRGSTSKIQPSFMTLTSLTS
jgi:hypothetical protein